MVLVPNPVIVTVVPEMVATLALLLVYENSPVLLLVGAVSWNGAALDTLVMFGKLERVDGGFSVMRAIPLEMMPSPPYTEYRFPLNVTVVSFVYVLFVSRRYT